MGDVETLIVGGGVSGMCMAIKLMKEGRGSFMVVEKSGEVGGTWSVNQYPGCGCDVPSHLYTFSFDRNPSWSRMYADRQEIHSYLRGCALRHRLLPHVRFHTLARAAAWDASAGLWRLHLLDLLSSQTCTLSAKFLVRAIGSLHVPKFPSVAGVHRFAGPSFHSSSWDNSVDLHGKVVAVVGTGASAIQMIPKIVESAKMVYVCQRTPSWILPKPDFAIADGLKVFFKQVPLLMWLFFWILFILEEVLVCIFLGGQTLRRLVEEVAKWHMKRSVKDVKMRALLVPKYEMGCKRLLVSNMYYPALTSPNVELLNEPILEIKEKSIVLKKESQGTMTNTRKIDVDVIIYATGFDAFTPNFEMEGMKGQKLSHGGSSSMLGITKKGFPNLFMLLGPNTWLGHTSLILMVEAQVRYILSSMSLVPPSIGSSMELREASEFRFQEFISRRFAKTVWNSCGGCSSWYLDPLTRHNSTIWPASTLEYIFLSWSANPLDYDFQ